MPLLERESVLGTLQAQLRLVADDREGRLVLLAGESGVGKTSVVQEFARAARPNATVLSGACDPLSTPTPLGPLLDIADQVTGPLAELLASGAPRAQVFAALRASLADTTRPTLVIFEDVHWADEATLDLLRFLGRRLVSLVALIIATYRVEEVGPTHPLRVALGDLATSSAIKRVTVSPLSEAAVRVLADRSGIDARELYRQTGGNPFFVTEVLATGLSEVPSTVRDTVLARATRLPPAARTALDVAAVIGASIEPALLADCQVTEDAIETCLSVGMLRSEGDGDLLSFRHELARAAILDAIPPTRRQALHRQVLDALRERTAGPDDWARLAHHAEAGRDAQAVLIFAPMAAVRAVQLRAHRAAAAQYARALRYTEALAPAQRAHLLEARANECFLIEQADEAVQARLDALAIRETLGDLAGQAENLRGLALAYCMLDRWTEARHAARRAIGLLETQAPGEQLAWAYGTQAHLDYLSGNSEGAAYWGGRAVVLAETLGTREVLMYALNNVGTIRGYSHADGLELLERSLQLALEANRDDDVGRAYVNIASVFIRQYQPLRAEPYVGDAPLSYSADHDLELQLSQLMGWRARCQLQAGDWTAAAETAAATLRRPRMLERSQVNPLLVLGAIRVRRGDPEAWGMLDRALALAPAIGEPIGGRAPIYAVRAEAAWLAGDFERCRVEARDGFALAELTGVPWLLAELAYWRWRAADLAAVPADAVGPFTLQVAGRWADAATDWRSRGCPYETAMALLDGDAVAVGEALTIFESYAAQPAAAIAARRLRELSGAVPARGPRPSTRAHPFGLTVRETEILDLLAQGLRNAEIADRLTLSERTVAHHVSTVLAKLGVRSRMEAVQLAARDRVV